MNQIRGQRTDLTFEDNLYTSEGLSIFKQISDEFTYHTIYFENSFIQERESLKESIKSILTFLIDEQNLPKIPHFFVVGLGSSSYTADSVGPKTLEYIKSNRHLSNLGIKQNSIVSSLEPGVLGQTGIEARKIIESVTKEIKPDLVILIDSFTTSNIDYLNHTIEINNKGITPGSGLHKVNMEINKKLLSVPVISIGVPTALEIELESIKKDDFTYLLSTSQVDKYIDDIAYILGSSIDEVLHYR